MNVITGPPWKFQSKYIENLQIPIRANGRHTIAHRSTWKIISNFSTCLSLLHLIGEQFFDSE